MPRDKVRAATRLLYSGLSNVWQTAMSGSSQEGASPEAKNAHKVAVDVARRAGTDPTMMDLVDSKSELISSINEALGTPMRDPKGAQLATIFPHEPSSRINEAGYPADEVPFYGWHGHLDGLWNGGAPVHQRTDRPMNEQELEKWNRDPGRNGVSRTFENKASNILNFTGLLGIPLSDQSEEGCGNVGLLTGAHRPMSKFFKHQRDKGGPIGPDGPGWERLDTEAPNKSGLRHYPEQVRSQFSKGAKYTKDGRMWPKPDLIKVKPGDAVLVLHATPHSSSRNESFAPRLMAYFRFVSSRRKDLKSGAEIDALCDCWLEWEGMR